MREKKNPYGNERRENVFESRVIIEVVSHTYSIFTV